MLENRKVAEFQRRTGRGRRLALKIAFLLPIIPSGSLLVWSMEIAGARPALQRPAAKRVRAAARDEEALQEFTERVSRYVQLHRRVAQDMPRLSDSSEAAQIAAHQQALARAIRATRLDAKEGDVFFPGARDQLIQIVRSEMEGPKEASFRATIREDDPEEEMNLAYPDLKVNASYPEGAPLCTMPPALLVRLPQLPRELEYRFVGQDLILRDVAANLFVDFIRGVIPQPLISSKVK